MERFLPRLLMPMARLWTIVLFIMPGLAVMAQQPFVTTWQTTNAGISGNDEINIPTSGSGYNYDVYWEKVDDAAVNGTETGITGDLTITFPSPGIYRVAITGDFPRIYFNNGGDKDKILTVDQWGDIAWKNMSGAFYGAKNLQVTTTEAPDLSEVESLSSMFRETESFNQDLSSWDVSHVSTMLEMFYGAKAFNGSLAGWQPGVALAGGCYLGGMFSETVVFNQDLSSWDVSHVNGMYNLFRGAEAFNSSLAGWKPGIALTNGCDAGGLFYDAAVFNQDLSSWDVSHVSSMFEMFRGALAFNGSLAGWKPGIALTDGCDAGNLFYEAAVFNQDLSSWDVSRVRSMYNMFRGALAFNGSLAGWKPGIALTNGCDAGSLFYEAAVFNQDLSSWDVSRVNSMYEMLSYSGISTANYDATLIGWAAQENVPSDIKLGADGLTYCAGADARQQLVADHQWSFTGDSEQCGAAITPGGSNILYVDINVNTAASGYTGAGDSWDNAIPQLADALKWAREQHDGGSPGWTETEPLRIFVAKGTYLPLYSAADGQYTTDGGRDNSFVLVPNVQLYGGFDPVAGIEILEDARILPGMDNLQQGSILSGDFNGNDNDDNYDNHTENAHHVTIVSGDVGSALMDGFTVTGGYATGNSSGSSVMGRTVYRFFGGGTYVITSSPQLTHMAWFNNLGEWGGGLYNSVSLLTEISSPELSNVTFYRNMAPGGGGGIRNFGGSVDIKQAIFANNGAGLVEDGTSSGPGGGIYSSGNGTSLAVTNATFYRNWIVGVFIPSFDGAAIQVEQTSTRLNNVVIWGNEVEGNPADPSASISISLGGDVTVANSLVAHSGGSANWNNAMGILDGGNNIDADPVFVSTTPGDAGYLQLSACSPAISAGSNQAYMDAGGDLADDLDMGGNPRVYNFASDGVIDMGAYEYQGERVLVQSLTMPDVVHVPYGTELADAENLPTAVTATLSDDTDVSIPLDGNLANWALASPAGGTYDGDVAGTYVFTVPLLTPETECYLNPENLQAEVTIEVAKGTPALVASWNGASIDATEGLSLTYGDLGELLFSTTDSDGVVTYSFGHGDAPVLDIADLSAVAAQQVGAATLTIEQETTDNFEAAAVEIVVTVATKAVTVVPVASQGKIYGANEPAAYGYELAEGDVLAFDDELADIVSAASRETGEDVGAYDIKLVFDGDQAGNYAISFEADNNAFTVTPLAITVTAEDKSKVFGADDPALTYTFAPELIGDDGFTGELDREVGEEVGIYNIIQGNLVLSDNYEIGFAGGTLTITPAAYEGIAFNNGSFVYDGTEHVLELTSELPEGTSVTYEIAGEVGNGATDAGVYDITALIDGGNNYEDAELTATLTITPLEITVTAEDKSKVFGADDPALTYTFTPELVGDDAFTGSLDRADGENVGTYAITQGNLALGDNYEIAFEEGTLTIISADYEGVEFNSRSFVYSGTEHVLELTGELPEGAAVTYEINGEPGNGATDAGIYQITAQIDGGANYEDGELTATLTILPAQITGISFNNTSSTYDGTEHRLTLAGELPAGASVTYENNGRTNVGRQTVTANIGGGENYKDVTLTAVLEVTPLAITVTAVDKTKIAGEEDPTLTYTSTPELIDADTFSGGLTREEGEEAGDYGILLGSLSAGDNYAITFERGTLTIMMQPLPPTEITGIALDDATFSYDGMQHRLSITGQLPHGVSVTYENNSRTDVGNQMVTATLSGEGYKTLVLTATLAIAPATRSIDFPALPETTYGDVGFDAEATASSGEEVTYTSDNLGVADVSADGTIAITGAGQVVITATVPENSNYTSRPRESRTLIVRKAPQTISFNAPAEVNRDAGSIQLDVSASGGLPVSLTIDDELVATLDGTTLNILRLGRVNITATQAGDANHEAAEPVALTIRVVDPTSDLPVRVHPVISPNGDGINEFLMIEAVTDYPENRVTIFNRNGTLLWEASGYDNNRVAFRGISTGQQLLPAGTYFYIVEVKDGNTWKHKKGYFVLRY